MKEIDFEKEEIMEIDLIKRIKDLIHFYKCL